MFSAEFASGTAGVLERLDGVLGELGGLDLTGYSDEQLPDLLSGVEARVRRFATIDHALVAETDDRGLGVQRGCANTATFLTRLLGIGAGQARLRVRAARELAPRRTLTGQKLQPQFPATAAALAVGAISPEQARVISSTIHGLPVEVREDSFDEGRTRTRGLCAAVRAGPVPPPRPPPRRGVGPRRSVDGRQGPRPAAWPVLPATPGRVDLRVVRGHRRVRRGVIEHLG
jgi:hypothetical protein